MKNRELDIILAIQEYLGFRGIHLTNTEINIKIYGDTRASSAATKFGRK